MATYYIILPQDYYQQCELQGRIQYDYADPHYAEDELHEEVFKKPYAYMLHEYRRRMGRGNRSLVWVWCQKPDLRHSAHLPKGTQGVRLTLELDPARVLVSDFDVWHMVLNAQSYEEEGFSSKAEQYKSWEIIFDPEIHLHPDLIDPLGRPPHRQGVISSIDMSTVTKVETFLAR